MQKLQNSANQQPQDKIGLVGKVLIVAAHAVSTVCSLQVCKNVTANAK